MPTEKEILEKIAQGGISLPPLQFHLFPLTTESAKEVRFAAFIEASWRDRKAVFAVECKSISTPKAFQNGLNILKTSSLPENCHPMLIMPFLSEDQLLELEREGISGVDLCSNGVVMVPETFAVFRSGEKNRFPSSATIKNIYRMNSSMVARTLLACSVYDTVQELCTEVNRRNLLVNEWDRKPMNLSTVSKSLKTLVEDLIIRREDGIQLQQADVLLAKLNENMAPLKVTARVRLKLAGDRDAIREELVKRSQELNFPVVATGMSSVGEYAVMQRGEMISVYCPRIEPLIERLPGNESDRFPNLELIETEDETVYFDAKLDGGFWWASPVQVYLELMAGDKRDRETAEQVKSVILQDIEPVRE